MRTTVKPLTSSQLSTLLPRLQATFAHLQTARSTKAAPNIKNSRADSQELRARILSSLTRRSGLRVSDVAEKCDCSLEAARYSLKLLRAKRAVKMVGKRATALWFKK